MNLGKVEATPLSDAETTDLSSVASGVLPGNSPDSDLVVIVGSGGAKFS